MAITLQADDWVPNFLGGGASIAWTLSILVLVVKQSFMSCYKCGSLLDCHCTLTEDDYPLLTIRFWVPTWKILLTGVLRWFGSVYVS